MDKKHRLDIYTGALRRAGLRLTPQRQAICEYLAQTEHHPSPYQVYADITSVHPEISRATVYNTLNTLQQLGAIVELSFGANHTHYDTNPEPHINLICLRCHKIVDFEGELALNEINQRVLREAGFQAAAAKVDLVGFCADCREHRRAEIRAQYQGDKP
jgi:Fur family peroxide stress response transcriptional regulator